ncbi:hypothetical protein ZEAMMB73_Zm00001d037986 [Zea mays]|uniref:MCM C-terminal AAA(+) ATPase domain-containing protein n=1 Tax=Zea mays TaxID=4577 RepID=A0A1D6M2M5_MAIZE|nr:hypothetical protein ZEAMMB73_Zm00001d037986 [Zea mays]
MEQQTISIAKAAITIILILGTSFLAAANPIARCYDALKCSLCYSALHMLKVTRILFASIQKLGMNSPMQNGNSCGGFYNGSFMQEVSTLELKHTSWIRLKPYEPWADGMWPARKPDAPEVPEAPRVTDRRTRMVRRGGS